MEEQTYNISNLSKNELKLILEALLYTSSVDVTGSYDQSHCKEFYNIAYKIRTKNPEVITENLEVFKHERIEFSDSITHEIVKMFPETIVEDIEL
jgi:hypothetical protein